ncbi:MAG: type II/IV secretion system ATPase subunit [Chloroflexi bacterium]|nr:type II/IV secretion system ATPase subunit [Chloroflexota bacterium]
MPFFKYPFEPRLLDDKDRVDPTNAAAFKKLPPELQARAREHLHLVEYLSVLPVDPLPVPKFTEKLSRGDSDNDAPNLIYPTLDGLFTHILADPDKGRDFYVAIEPRFEHVQFDSIINEVEAMLLEYTEEFDAAKTPQDLARALGESLDKIYGHAVGSAPTKATRTALMSAFAGLVNKFQRRGGTAGFLKKWSLTPLDQSGLRYTLIKNKVGVGVIEPLIKDPYIEDISCSGVGQLFVEHKIFKSLRTSFGFKSFHELDEFVLRLSERIKKPVTFRMPVVDATLPDGSRINIVYGKDISTRGSNFSIRKTFDEPISITQLVKWGSISWTMAAYLSLVIEDGLNIFVSGETASGKTTLLNALATFIAPSAKIVSIEDTAEVQLPHQNWIREVTRKAKPGETDSGVGMFELLKAALRQRPNEIIIGEIRGEEGAIAFQAMQTGHPCLATFHASSVQKLIQRLTGHPINVPKIYVDNLNVVVIQMSVRLPNGKMGRRALSINEIVGYDSETGSFSFVEAFRWDPATDVFEFSGNMNSYILEHKIAVNRGYPYPKRRQIYTLLNRRARVLEKLADSGVLGYYDLYKVLAKANREGVF